MGLPTASVRNSPETIDLEDEAAQRRIRILLTAPVEDSSATVILKRNDNTVEIDMIILGTNVLHAPDESISLDNPSGLSALLDGDEEKTIEITPRLTFSEGEFVEVPVSGELTILE